MPVIFISPDAPPACLPGLRACSILPGGRAAPAFVIAQQSPQNGFPWRPVIAGAWLLFVVAFSLGMLVYDRQWWPYGLVQDFRDFLSATEEAELGVAEALGNDLGLVPARHLITLRTPFDRGRPYTRLEGLPLRQERAAPQVWLGPDALEGYRLIHGVFAFEDRLHGVVLLGPEGTVLRHWPITQEDVTWAHRPDDNVVPHGMAVTRNGSLILAFDAGTSLRRLSWCGALEWVVMGGFHHSVDLNEDGVLWTWGQVIRDRPYGRFMIQLDPDTGEVLRQIRLEDVIDANPDIDIFGIRQDDGNQESRFQEDPWHANDLEALPASLAAHYPDFEAGDLVSSYRSIDLVFVMDPDTLRVKWWRQGLVRRQHDPDFNRRGTISIFDNNMHRGMSRIVDIDPVTFAHRTVVAGEDHGFYSWRRGKHQELPDGGWLVTSTEQGRAFEVGPDGELRFEFLNPYDEERFLPVSQADWLAADWFRDLPDCSAP